MAPRDASYLRQQIFTLLPPSGSFGVTKKAKAARLGVSGPPLFLPIRIGSGAFGGFRGPESRACLPADDIYVKECFVDGGAMMKRILPAPMGRAFRMLKRSNHVTIVVAQREAKKK